MVGIKIGDKLIINIPLQFDVIARNHRVITDGFTNEGRASDYNQPSSSGSEGALDDAVDIASSLASKMSIPPELVAVMKQQQTEAMGLLGDVLPKTATEYDPQTNAWVDPPEGTTFAGAMDEASEALSGSVGSLQSFIDTCTETANDTIVSSMNALQDIGAATDIAGIQAAVAANAPPNLVMGGVLPGAQQLQKFSDTAKSIKGSTGEVGNVVSQVTDIAKNATMLAAMGSLSQGIAKAAGLPPPPSMNVAFEGLTTGHIGQAMNVMHSGMSVVNSVASMSPYSGQLDDINDLVWQESFGPSGLSLPFAGITVPLPTWENTIPCGNLLTGQFPLGGSIGSMMEMAKEQVLTKLAECNAAITAAMQPLTELGAAAAMIQQLGDLPDALRRNLSNEMMNLATQAFSSMYPNISLTIPPMPPPLTNINCDPAEIFETLHGGGSGSGGSVLDFAANIGSTITSAGHGTVWKPASEKDGSLVVLLPRKFGKATVTVGGDVGTFSGFTNGNRGTYRFPNSGASYGSSTSVSIAGGASGTTKTVTVTNPGTRQTG
jgi:hypothetical protein